MSKYDLEKPKRYRVKAKHGINTEKSNSVNLSHMKLKEIYALFHYKNLVRSTVK
jgi:hypothetical protein